MKGTEGAAYTDECFRDKTDTGLNATYTWIKKHRWNLRYWSYPGNIYVRTPTERQCTIGEQHISDYCRCCECTRSVSRARHHQPIEQVCSIGRRSCKRAASADGHPRQCSCCAHLTLTSRRRNNILGRQWTQHCMTRLHNSLCVAHA